MNFINLLELLKSFLARGNIRPRLIFGALLVSLQSYFWVCGLVLFCILPFFLSH
jgi:hypothetical protein